MFDEAWLSHLFEDNYALLYRIGRVFLGTDTTQTDLIEDQIQETFVLAWRHEQKVRNHPNPVGWLVETFRRRMMAQCRKLGREWKHQAFSMDKDDHPDVVDSSALSVESFVQGVEQAEMLTRLLGKRDTELFLRYCVQGESAGRLAADYQMSESGVRVRISR